MKASKKIVIMLLVVVELCLVYLMYKSSNNKEVLDNKEISEKKEKFAIMVQDENGKYTRFSGSTFPGEGYVLNVDESKCLDIEGNKIENVINRSNGSVTLTNKYTSYCTLYFDIAKKITDLSGNNNFGTSYAASWGVEGVTTSNEQTIGYIDCGLENYDFKNSITIIVRAKVNQSPTEYNARLISNGSNLNEIAINLTGNRVSSVHFGNGWFGYSKSININEYNTFVSKYDANNCNLFINGDNGGKKVCTKSSYISNNSFYLGGSPNFDDSVGLSVPIMATFTDVLIFDTALTDEEIKEYFSGEINKDKVINNYVNNKDKKLLLYYRFI